MSNSLLDTIQHIRLVQSYLDQLATRLHARALMHDNSKLQEPELSGYEGLSGAVAGLQYGSMAYRSAFAPYKEIITHHYEVNDHHPEHFSSGVADMTLLQFVEILADWKAASMRNSDTLKQSLDASLTRFWIDGQLAQLVRNTIEELDW